MTEHTSQTATRRLRLVLRANAAFSFASGAIALLAGPWISRELGIDHVVLTRLLGAGLIGFAAIVVVISRLDVPRLRAESALVSMADGAWVLGSIVVLLTGWLSTTGDLVVAGVGFVVADFGSTQLWFRAKATVGHPERHTAAA